MAKLLSRLFQLAKPSWLAAAISMSRTNGVRQELAGAAEAFMARPFQKGRLGKACYLAARVLLRQIKIFDWSVSRIDQSFCCAMSF